MICVGLTGGIASGKSTVSAMLRELGAHVICADEASHRISRQPQTLKAISRAFGDDFIEGGQLDSKALGKLVFSDAEARLRLEAILHPRVIESMLDEKREITERDPDAIIVLDAALLFESGLDAYADAVWVVDSGGAQLERLLLRDSFDGAEAARRISAQMERDERARRADAVIDNSGDLRRTREQVAALYADLWRKYPR